MAAKNTEDVCKVFCYDEERVARLRSEVKMTEGLTRIFKALADETRIKIVYALLREELCVCDVAQIIGSTVATASHHLRLLSNLGLAKYRKEGKMVFYSLEDECVKTIVEAALYHFKHRKD